MSEDMIPITLDSPMGFKCSRRNACFNDCCRDLNQALTPYDVLRLKNNLKMKSQDFLRTYTARHIGPGSGLPVVAFKPNPATGHACPFVQTDGCSVYPDRPGSCRLYPLARAIVRNRETGDVSEFYALIHEPHCLGFGIDSRQTVGEWLSSQDVATHNRYNDTLISLISLKNQIRPGKLDGAVADDFYLGLYDLDEFRCRIFDQGLLNDQNIPSGIMDRIREDDDALLSLGIRWVKYRLFGMDMGWGCQRHADQG